MPLVRCKNETLIDKREGTYLTAAVAAAGVTLTVVDNSNFLTDNDYVLLGKIGTESAEIVQINGAGTVGTSITVDQQGSGGCRFAHSIFQLSVSGTSLYCSFCNLCYYPILCTGRGSYNSSNCKT